VLSLRDLEDLGVLQGSNGPPSSSHSKVEPGSEEVNSNVACFFFVLFLGPLVIVVSGGAVTAHGPCVEASLGH
jgi:hypothetical protein